METTTTRDYLSEINRLTRELAAAGGGPTPPGGRATVFVAAVIVLSILAVATILTIFMVRPDRDNTALIAIVLGFLVPIVSAFLAASVQQVHLAVNSRLSQLLLVTQTAALAEGKLSATADARERHDALTLRREDAAVVAAAVIAAAAAGPKS